MKYIVKNRRWRILMSMDCTYIFLEFQLESSIFEVIIIKIYWKYCKHLKNIQYLTDTEYTHFIAYQKGKGH